MTRLTALLKAEPVALDAAVVALIALLTGWPVVRWSPEQTGLVLAAYKAVSAVLVRALVTPVPKAEQQAQQAASAERREIHAYLKGAQRRPQLRADAVVPGPGV